MLRREFLRTPGLLAIASSYQLIAHRGGVVEGGRPENSAAALQTALERGYWMVEVDVRRSRDGEPVLYHDAQLGKYHSSQKSIEAMTWKEISKLRPALQHFEEACQRCQGKMRLMLDLKGSDWPAEFYSRIWKTMEAAKIPGPVYSLGGARVLPLFAERVMVSINPKELAGREVNPRHFFLFDLASNIDGGVVELARKRGVQVAAAINTFRYTMAKRDEESGPREDFVKLKSLGVRCYQVDSRYEGLFS